MRTLIPRLTLALGAAAWLPLVAQAQGGGGAKVKITAPRKGATVSAPVKVTLVGDWKHVPLKPLVVDTVTFTVK